MKTLEIGQLKRESISDPVKAASSSQGARASPPTMYQVPRYDAIAPPHRAGAKKNPKAIHAAVAPHPDRKLFVDFFRDSSRNGRLTARASASRFDPATMPLPRVTRAPLPLLHFETLTLADVEGLNDTTMLQPFVRCRMPARTTDAPAIEGTDAACPPTHPGCNPWANLKSIPRRCHPILVAFVWELTKETIYLPMGFLQGGSGEREDRASVLGSGHRCRLAPRALPCRGQDGAGRGRDGAGSRPGGNPGANGWFLESTSIQMPPRRGGICGRLT